MNQFAMNLAISASLISVSVWLAKTYPTLGGFIISLPVSTLIALAVSKIQNDDVGNTFALAKSIFVAVPASLLFFIPFLLADRLKLSFWTSYALGIILLVVSFFIHRWITTHLP